MSIGPRLTLPRALELADAFERLLMPARTCQRFLFAGSLRRRKVDVGDFDIVAIPKLEDMPAADMFATPTLTNLLWHRVDELLALGTFAKHVKETAAGPRTTWGEKERAIEFRGCAFEINLADADSWGLTLAVKTGPHPLPQDLVTRLPKYGYASRNGFQVWDTKATPAKLVPQPTEEQIFKMAGLEFRPPESR